MEKTLLITATDFEIKQAAKWIQKNKKGQVLITGIGCPATIYALTKRINVYKPGIIIQAGIAGCFDKKLALGEVVAVTLDRFGDIGVVENNVRKTVFETGLVKANEKPFKNEALINPNNRLLKQTGLKTVNAVTVNEITTARKDILYYKDQLGATVESMEGAALHYVALMEKIPFIQLRSISNYVGERDKSKWRMQEAIDNLNKELMDLVGRL